MADEERQPETAEQTPPTRRRWRRVAGRVLAVLVALVAGVLVSVLTVDLGPTLRTRAEKAGSNYVHRPMHIGKLSAKLIPGVFVVEDIVIEGLTPQDRPWLKAKKITVNLPWWTIFTRKLTIESIDMTDWEMVVESWSGGRHNFPSFGDKNKKKGPSRFTTTLRSVVAARGQFIYDDHSTPWDVAARNLTVAVYRSATNYRGRASFSNGDVKIQSYERFRLDMQSQFAIDKGIVHFDRIDLDSEGARSVLDGDVDMGRWPEQLYRITSHIDFPTQKRIFFHNDRFNVSGQGDFTGTFHLFKGGRELKGTFDSPVAGVRFGLDPRASEWTFPKLHGSVLWLPERFDVTDTTCELYGGTARFNYLMGPLGEKDHPARAVWDVQYRDVDLARLTDFLGTEGIRIAGRATGRNRLEWPLGKWALKRGGGEITAVASGGTAVMTRQIPEERLAQEIAHAPEAGPFNSHAPLGYVPIAGHVVYRLDPEWITLDEGWTATPKTYVEFQGRTAYAERSRIPFHVTSLDWQESDRVLAGIMTAFGSPTGATPIGGYGEFDGVMIGAFSKPRVEGVFTGDRMRAWDVLWGRGTADIVVENSYALVSKSEIASGDSVITAEGKFSLGYPRKDKGEEIDARVRLTRRPLADLRHAFELDDYPVDGVASGEYHLYGNYETPFGFGTLLVENGVAYGETFEKATASLRFEGNGVRLDGISITKGAGTVTGAAWVGWAGDYSFNADGRRIAVESLRTVAFPKAPLSGLMQFNATGAGTFAAPRYDVKVSVADLFAGEEGIGQVNANLALRNELLVITLEAASPRLVVSGSGRIALTPEMDAEMTLRFDKTSLDPYIRFFQPQMSPFTTAIAGGTVRVVGELTDIDHLVVDTRVEDLDLKLFDYRLRNEGPIELSLDRHVLNIQRFKLAGEETELTLDGDIAFDENRIAVSASGDANLGILQGFFRDIRSSGSAALKAEITGPLEKPVFAGSATLTNGRIRYFSLPHSLEAINGRLSFDAAGVRLDDVKARLGGGNVTFGGRIALNGFALGDLSLTAVGEQMHLRYPEGFRSVVDADLALRGPVTAPVLSGAVRIRDAVWSRRIDANVDIFSLTRGSAQPIAGPAAPSTFPLRLDVHIVAPPGSLRVETGLLHLASSADLQLQGTYDRPLLFGRADIERGDLVLEGNRYVVTRGSVDFFNRARIEPFFDVEAEARIRVPSQTYRITIGVNGTYPRPMTVSLNSDPPLPQVDILSLMLGQTTNVENAELRSLQAGAAQASEQQLLQAAGARLLTGALSAPVGRAVEQTFGIDTVQITPMFGTGENDPLTASARLIIGKRISNRAYITFARALGTASRDQILVLEYDQSDTLGWVLTQNGDRTFALDFRVRRRF